jgi:hypothetical protein
MAALAVAARERTMFAAARITGRVMYGAAHLVRVALAAVVRRVGFAGREYLAHAGIDVEHLLLDRIERPS